MAYDVIKLDYELAGTMAQTFNQSSQQLSQVLQEIQKLAAQMDNGALVGSAGSKFSETINGAFATSMKKLIDKIDELEKDVQGAISDMRAADKDSASLFA